MTIEKFNALLTTEDSQLMKALENIKRLEQQKLHFSEWGIWMDRERPKL